MKSCGCNFVTVFLKCRHGTGFLTVSVTGNSGVNHAAQIERDSLRKLPKVKGYTGNAEKPFPLFVGKDRGERLN